MAETLIDWLKTLRSECRALNGILRGARRDNALRHTIFHREAMACCRVVAAWYRDYKRPIVSTFLAEYRRRKRRKTRRRQRGKKAEALATSKLLNPSEAEQAAADYRKARASKLQQRDAARSGNRAHAVSAHESKMRGRVLKRVVRCGLACSAELSLARRNTVPLALALLAAFSRLHFLLSETSDDAGCGAFGRWLGAR